MLNQTYFQRNLLTFSKPAQNSEKGDVLHVPLWAHQKMDTGHVKKAVYLEVLQKQKDILGPKHLLPATTSHCTLLDLIRKISMVVPVLAIRYTLPFWWQLELLHGFGWQQSRLAKNKQCRWQRDLLHFMHPQEPCCLLTLIIPWWKVCKGDQNFDKYSTSPFIKQTYTWNYGFANAETITPPNFEVYLTTPTTLLTNRKFSEYENVVTKIKLV